LPEGDGQLMRHLRHPVGLEDGLIWS
jgi:hypothetical protein